MSEESLPENWKRCLSKKFKQYYYFNSVTNESSWIHPLLKGSHKKSTASTTTLDENENDRLKKKRENTSRSCSEASFKVKKSVKKGSVIGKKLSVKALQTLASPINQEKTIEIAKWNQDVVKGRNLTIVEKKPYENWAKNKRKKKQKDNQSNNDNRENSEEITLSSKSQGNNKNNSKTQLSITSEFSNKSEATEQVGERRKDRLSTSEIIDTTIHKSRYKPYKKNVKCTTDKAQNTKQERTPKLSTSSGESSTTIKNLTEPEKTQKNPFLCSLKNNQACERAQELTVFQKEKSPFNDAPDRAFHWEQPNVGIDFNVRKTSNENIFMNDTTIHNMADLTDNSHFQNNTEVIHNIAEQFVEQEEENMEIDDDPQIIREISRKIRGFRDENVLVRPELPNENEVLQATDLPTYTDPLYIVLDTNVLLSHLKFVQELKDYPIPGIGAPILYIPWIVLQELDSLKDAVKRYHTQVNKDGGTKSYQLSAFARNAINFINTCLGIDHPRLKGQSAIEAGTPIDGFVEETNDDSIIHAALGLKLRALHSHIVVFSNDRNLCNKCMVAGIKAFSHQNLMMGLRSLFQSGTVVVRKENFAEYFEEYKIQELIAKRRRQSDELSCELQCILREGLTKVIEDEMKDAYGEDLWLKIVKIQPPWTLRDSFELLEKHWIAVFGMIVKRQLVDVVGQLKKTFQTCEGSPGSLEKTKELLELSLRIFEGFATRSSYDDMLTSCITGIKVLHKKCIEFIKQMVPLKQLPDTKPVEVENQGLNAENSGESTIVNEPRNPYEKVMGTFDTIWRTVIHFSALIFYSLDFPSPLIKEIDPNEPKPHPKEALNCLKTMTNCLLSLIKKIQMVIHIPVEKLSSSEQTIDKLLEGILVFMKEVMKQDCDVQPTELLQFCQDSNTRSALVQGLSQLDRSYAMLQQCIEYHQTVI